MKTDTGSTLKQNITIKWKEYLFSILAFVIISFGININYSFADSILYDSLDQAISTTTTDFGNCVNANNATGFSDNNYADCTLVSGNYYAFGSNRNFINPSGLPTGAIIDAVIYTIHASSSVSQFYGAKLKIGSLNINPVGNTIGPTPNYYQYNYDNTNLTSSQLQQLTQANFDNISDPSYGWSLNFTSGGTRHLGIDQIERTFFYHYDSSNTISRINTFTIYPLDTTIYPNIVNATSSITTTYYKNSSDSTGYTKLQYKNHDFTTNTDDYILSNPITTDITYATNTINNFCNGGMSYCENWHTYQLAVRFSNNDGSVVSSWFPTYYYYAYIQSADITSTTSAQVQATLWGINPGSTTTIQTSMLYGECGISDIGGCLKNAFIWAFVPDSEQTKALINNLQTTYQNKPPFGYITSITGILNQASTTASSTDFNLGIPTSGPFYTIIISPARTGISILFYFLLAYIIFKRFQHFEF